MYITLNFDNETQSLLEHIAQADHVSVEVLVQRAVQQFVRQRVDIQSNAKRGYSFIGIGHSEKTDLSERASDAFANGTDDNKG